MSQGSQDQDPAPAHMYTKWDEPNIDDMYIIIYIYVYVCIYICIYIYVMCKDLIGTCSSKISAKPKSTRRTCGCDLPCKASDSTKGVRSIVLPGFLGQGFGGIRGHPWLM
jgi:hypothetical protein